MTDKPADKATGPVKKASAAQPSVPVQRVPAGKPEIKAVISESDVIKRKPPIWTRARSVIFHEDVTSVARYLRDEVFIPAIKDLIVNSVTRGIDRSVYGSDVPRSGPRRMGNMTMYDTPSTRIRSNTSPINVPSYPAETRPEGIDDLVFASREAAEAVVNEMLMILESYPYVTVANAFEIARQIPNPVDNAWGWTELPRGSVYIQTTSRGFVIRLPKPMYLTNR